MLIVKQNGKYGYADRKGDIVIDCKYDDAGWFNEEGYAVVQQNGKYGKINKQGEVVLACIYDEIIEEPTLFDTDIVKLNGKYGLLNFEGEFQIFPIYDHLEVYKKYNFRATLNGKIIIMDDMGESPNTLEPSINEKLYGYVKEGTEEVVLEYQFENASYFANGLAKVKKNGKWGLIDYTGNFVIQNIYDKIEPFNKGKAKATKDGKEFYINTKGEIIE